MEATGPRTLQDTVDEMFDEGCRLVKELKLADAHIEKLEEQLKTVSTNTIARKIDDLEGELSVALAERDQADAKVMEQEKQIEALKLSETELLEEVSQLKLRLQEWEDLEGWRQGRWVLLQDELKKLRAELASLRNESAPVVN